jgi:hypothetical protein
MRNMFVELLMERVVHQHLNKEPSFNLIRHRCQTHASSRSSLDEVILVMDSGMNEYWWNAVSTVETVPTEVIDSSVSGFTS